MMFNRRNKKAFTMIELIFVVIIGGFMSLKLFQVSQEKLKQDEGELALQHIVELVDRFIYNPTSGYATDKGGDCSSDFSVRNISAYRIQQCASIPAYEVGLVGGSTDYENGEKSYFKLFEGYGEETQEGLRVYINDVNDYEIAIFFEILSSDKAKMEQYIGSLSQKNLKSKFVSITYEAESLPDTTLGGNMNDGLLRVNFKD